MAVGLRIRLVHLARLAGQLCVGGKVQLSDYDSIIFWIVASLVGGHFLKVDAIFAGSGTIFILHMCQPQIFQPPWRRLIIFCNDIIS